MTCPFTNRDDREVGGAAGQVGPRLAGDFAWGDNRRRDAGAGAEQHSACCRKPTPNREIVPMMLGLPCKLATVSTFFALLFAWDSFGLAIFAADAAPTAATVIRVDTTQARHTIAAGIGASWHAMGQTPFWYRDLVGRDNRTCRGSGFGGKWDCRGPQGPDTKTAFAPWRATTRQCLRPSCAGSSWYRRG